MWSCSARLATCTCGWAQPQRWKQDNTSAVMAYTDDVSDWELTEQVMEDLQQPSCPLHGNSCRAPAQHCCLLPCRGSIEPGVHGSSIWQDCVAALCRFRVSVGTETVNFKQTVINMTMKVVVILLKNSNHAGWGLCWCAKAWPSVGLWEGCGMAVVWLSLCKARPGFRCAKARPKVGLWFSSGLFENEMLVPCTKWLVFTHCSPITWCRHAWVQMRHRLFAIGIKLENWLNVWVLLRNS